MIVNFNQILSELDKRIFHPVYFLTGDETYFIDTISNYIGQNILNETEKTFNLNILYGKEVNISQLKELCLRFPMMSELSITVLREAQELKKGLDELIPYMENPNKTNILVVCYKYGKLDGRGKLYKVLKNSNVCCLMEEKKIRDDMIPGWIEQYLKKRGFSITKRAILLLNEYLGNDLSKVVNELEKLILIQKESKYIDLSEVETNIGINKEYNNFELQKALSVRDIVKTTKIINYYSNNAKNISAQLMLGTLFSFFSKAYILENAGNKTSIIANEIGIQDWQVNDFLTTISNFRGKLTNILNMIYEYDLRSKGITDNNLSDLDLIKEITYKILTI